MCDYWLESFWRLIIASRIYSFLLPQVGGDHVLRCEMSLSHPFLNNNNITKIPIVPSTSFSMMSLWNWLSSYWSIGVSMKKSLYMIFLCSANLLYSLAWNTFRSSTFCNGRVKWYYRSISGLKLSHHLFVWRVNGE